jgi:hypothetical protein
MVNLGAACLWRANTIIKQFTESLNDYLFSILKEEALNAIHPQPPNLQLIKVALRA